MLELKKTTNKDPDFLTLVQQLDENLKVTDGEDHDFYNQYNGLEQIHHILVGYLDNKPVCCGAFKVLSSETAEVKRMYTSPQTRGQGFAKIVLTALEHWAQDSGHEQLVLETGINQHAAIALYTGSGYNRISNYGPYKGVAGSFCFGKKLRF